jgi:hypothetical protein
VKRSRIYFLLFAAAACTEQSTAPGVCPDYCPAGEIQAHDSVFTIIERDSSFRGYAQSHRATSMTVADEPGVIDSRAFFSTDTIYSWIQATAADTTTVPKVVDSLRLRLVIVRRPTHTTGLTLRVYRLPITVDSTSDFASLDPYFVAAPIDSVNISSLLQQPGATDTAITNYWRTLCPGCIDSVRVDADHNVLLTQIDSTLLIYMNLDTLQAPLSEADTGRMAFGFRVAADSLASVGLGTSESGTDSPLLRWFYHYTIPDTVSAKPDSVVHQDKIVAPRFDNFVFNPPTPALDSNLAIGGVPSAHAVLRVALPNFLHDTIDIVRASLILVPVSAVQGVASDSFRITAYAVFGDLGAKSPVNSAATGPDGAVLSDSVVVHIGTTDTVRLELTRMVRAWTLDTSLVTTFVLVQHPEVGSYTEARFYSTRAPAFRPALSVTWVSRFQFGRP